jgi:putative transposase
MARMARVVAPGYPHLLTQRGSGRLRAFFNGADYLAYLNFMAEWCARCGVAVWAYCLMPNHVHLLAVPRTAGGLARAVGRANRWHARQINFRQGRRGSLWQGRFGSCVLDAQHALAAARYIEQNPVRAGLVKYPWDWPWSSAGAHLVGSNDVLVRVRPLLAKVSDWRQFLIEEEDEATLEALRLCSRTGRPLGAADFVAQLESSFGRRLRPRKPGPRPGRRRRRK